MQKKQLKKERIQQQLLALSHLLNFWASPEEIEKKGEEQMTMKLEAMFKALRKAVSKTVDYEKPKASDDGAKKLIDGEIELKPGRIKQDVSYSFVEDEYVVVRQMIEYFEK